VESVIVASTARATRTAALARHHLGGQSLGAALLGLRGLVALVFLPPAVTSFRNEPDHTLLPTCLRKTPCLLNFPYVCPEPVLVK
jgi:hypothetical protein